MSRIGKVPVKIPEKVEVKISGNDVSVKGPKGSMQATVNSLVSIKIENGQVLVEPKDQSKESRSQWGTARTLIGNMVKGVHTGFVRSLEFNGVGYKAQVTGNVLTLNLGYSHPIDHQLPQGISAKVNKNQIDIEGCDKELVGQVAAKVRSYREPEPYKGKGIKYLEETIIRKAGKAGGKGK